VPNVAIILGDPDRYAPNWIYEGSYEFRKHLFPFVGKLGSDGDEHRCAVHLDEQSEVECWMRNLERRVADSFWLQTSRSRFYPDFIRRLKDGRVFALEFRGEHLWTADEAKEKRAVGQLWAERTGGSCIFVMPNGTAWGEIDAALRPIAP
jgi:type III restriction enzyme